MENRNLNALPAQADTLLRQAPYSPKKLVLLHTGVALGVSLIATVLNLILSRQIDATGGLAGMGLRSVLSTIQSVLDLAGSLALPFWEMGIFAAAFLWASGQVARPQVLPEGFRRFGPVLRLRLLQAVMLVALFMVLIYPASFIFMLTPWADPLLEQLQSLASPDMTELTPQMLEATAVYGQPLVILCFVLFGCVAIPLLFRLRFAPYLLMGTSQPRALAAMLESARLTRRNCLRLLKLDLHFWWYYALQTAAAVLCYGDILLALFGVSLPWSDTAVFFLFYCLGLGSQLALFVYARPRVVTSYALAAQALQPEEKPATLPEA